MNKEFRTKLFRGSKIADTVDLLDRLAKQSKERAERYINNENLSSELHEGMYQGYKDAIDIIQAEFNIEKDK